MMIDGWIEGRSPLDKDLTFKPAIGHLILSLFLGYSEFEVRCSISLRSYHGMRNSSYHRSQGCRSKLAECSCKCDIGNWQHIRGLTLPMQRLAVVLLPRMTHPLILSRAASELQEVLQIWPFFFLILLSQWNIQTVSIISTNIRFVNLSLKNYDSSIPQEHFFFAMFKECVGYP